MGERERKRKEERRIEKVRKYEIPLRCLENKRERIREGREGEIEKERRRKRKRERKNVINGYILVIVLCFQIER
jgi:hypothetical protein